MEVHKDRRVLLPHAGGKTDLRTRLLEVFQQADSKGTPGGTLDATELASKIDLAQLRLACEHILVNAGGLGGGKVTLSELCNALVADEDGKVTLADFTNAFKAKLAVDEASPEEAVDANVNKVYDFMDTNNDGVVDKIEFLEFIRVHKPKHGTWNSVAKLNDAFGFNKTSSITREKFHAAIIAAEGLEVTSFDYPF